MESAYGGTCVDQEPLLTLLVSDEAADNDCSESVAAVDVYYASFPSGSSRVAQYNFAAGLRSVCGACGVISGGRSVVGGAIPGTITWDPGAGATVLGAGAVSLSPEISHKVKSTHR
jgi:hypothetical protein